MTTTSDQDQLRRFVAALHRRPDEPHCECRHGPAQAPCPHPARFRVVLLCQVEDCDCAVRSHLACACCKESWVRQARADPNAPRLRIEAL